MEITHDLAFHIMILNHRVFLLSHKINSEKRNKLTLFLTFGFGSEVKPGVLGDSQEFKNPIGIRFESFSSATMKKCS